jgi:hypothetical protein
VSGASLIQLRRVNIQHHCVCVSHPRDLFRAVALCNLGKGPKVCGIGTALAVTLAVNRHRCADAVSAENTKARKNNSDFECATAAVANFVIFRADYFGVCVADHCLSPVCVSCILDTPSQGALQQLNAGAMKKRRCNLARVVFYGGVWSKNTSPRLLARAARAQQKD